MSECPPPHQQDISGTSTRNHSQSFVGSARDVYLIGSKSPQEASEQAASVCRNALFLTDPSVDRESLISAKGTRVAGTCEWITHNESYRAWLNGSTRLLWISGGPGKGKTMLSVFLTEELEKKTVGREDAQLVYYFCSHQDEKRNTVVAVLRGLVRQIITKRPQLVQHALPYFEPPERIQQTLSSLETLWIIFSKLVRDAELGAVFCVLDGLDECDEGALRVLLPRIVSLLAPAATSTCTTAFRLAIVSRDLHGLQGCVRVKLDPDYNEKVVSDIERFIFTRVDELARLEGFNDEFRVTVQTTLLARAEGTFLWVGFAMHELSQKLTCSQVLKSLNDLPGGLPKIYGRMLLQIPSEWRDTTSKILRWVTLAQRPLQLQELAAAVGTQPSPPLTVEQAIRDEIALCGPFLKVQEQQVSLVHQSARDYLVRKEHDSDAVLEEFRIELENAHLVLTQICLDCIAQSGLQHAPLALDNKSCSQESSLLMYAAFHWPEHAKSCSSLDVELLCALKQFLYTKPTSRRHWWATYRNKKRLSLPQTIPLLHMLCFLGFLPLVRTAVAWESWTPRCLKYINRKDSEGNTALHLATRARNQTMIQVLIDNGAEVNARDKYKKTSLHWAAEAGDEEIVKLLVSKGADVNAKRDNEETVLHSAFLTRRNNAVVQMLVDKGANVNAKNNYGATALHLACWEMNVEIVQSLVDGGADVNAIGMNGRTVLHSAVEYGRESQAVIRTLVSKGADVNTRGSNGSTVLHWAARAGNKAIVRLLVDIGAAVNTKDNSGRTALHWAVNEIDVAVVFLLFGKGANIRAKTDSGRTVLHEAISAVGGASIGNKALVQLLVIMGADIKAKDEDGKTALHLAAEVENKAVVHLLRIEEWASKRRRTEIGRQQLRQRTRFLAALAFQSGAD